ncbi:hypothetical protein COO60DRAFT_1705646 [Scenedesmus sp. NREL 46B-D3]|nr:hypothetical protein COO60DRAFT_1705646 [Scenedesmus sp. NREL 46B-D3]
MEDIKGFLMARIISNWRKVMPNTSSSSSSGSKPGKHSRCLSAVQRQLPTLSTAEPPAFPAATAAAAISGWSGTVAHSTLKQQQQQQQQQAGAARRGSRGPVRKSPRQRKVTDAQHLKGEVAAVLARNSELQQRLDEQRTEHGKTIVRMADVTAKWQATVAENARLNAALTAAKMEAAELQQLLLQCQQQQQQQHCQLNYY